MRITRLFNDNWLFTPKRVNADTADALFEPITLPHTNKHLPHSNFDNLEYQFEATYRKHFELPQSLDGHQVFLDFEGVMLASSIHLNDEKVGEHLGGYSPFSINITPLIQDGENLLTVHVDAHERKDVPPYGHLVDFLTFGGIYRDVNLRMVPSTHIENIFVQTADVLSAPHLTAQVQLSVVDSALTIEATLRDAQGIKIAQAQGAADQQVTTVSIDQLTGIALWTLDDPALYFLEIELFRDGALIDSHTARFGFREAEFRPDGGFYLNGQRVDLVGLNRHQTFPYIGAAAPARLQRRDADILKYDLACNIVRTSHYPQSSHFLDRCDEIGLLVFEELTGWQHIGDQAWQELSLQDLEAMILRDRNHPSIMLWGVRINESPDNDSFYQRTNDLAHTLDPTRQTGGVRNFLGSSFLEDVYTYNDFSNTVLDPKTVPYLITEFAGHMFPTKVWDHEERLIDHALLHANIHNLQIGNPRISGAIGWCAFDYNTHLEFGSGDRICYHGVMDIFRLPKWAAYLYKSQQSPAKQIVLQAATHWTMGDRSVGGFDPLTVFSNCDEIEIIIGDESVGKYAPDTEHYPHLAHPPFTVNGLDKYSAWGRDEYHDLVVDGFVNGKKVATHRIASSRLPKRLELVADDTELFADGADMTRLSFRITDDFGNALPYATQIVYFELEGEADLVGENPYPLIGGQAALYLKARHKTGIVKVRAYTNELISDLVEVKLIHPLQN